MIQIDGNSLYREVNRISHKERYNYDYKSSLDDLLELFSNLLRQNLSLRSNASRVVVLGREMEERVVMKVPTYIEISTFIEKVSKLFTVKKVDTLTAVHLAQMEELDKAIVSTDEILLQQLSRNVGVEYNLNNSTMSIRLKQTEEDVMYNNLLSAFVKIEREKKAKKTLNDVFSYQKTPNWDLFQVNLLSNKYCLTEESLKSYLSYYERAEKYFSKWSSTRGVNLTFRRAMTLNLLLRNYLDIKTENWREVDRNVVLIYHNALCYFSQIFGGRTAYMLLFPPSYLVDLDTPPEEIYLRTYAV